MIENLGLYYLKIDFNDIIYKNGINIYFKDGDIKTSKIRIKLVKGKSVINLNGLSVSIRIQSNTVNFTENVEIIDAVNGIIEYTFKTNQLQSNPNYFEIVLQEGELIKVSHKINYYVMYGIDEDNSVIGSDNYPILLNLIKDCNLLVDSEVVRVSNETVRQELKIQLDALKVNLDILQINLVDLNSVVSTQESTRQTNEVLRQELKIQMDSLKTDLTTLQTNLNLSESTRQSNETLRETLKSQLDTLKTTLTTLNDTLNTNENTRISQESTRQSNETLRESSFNSKITEANDKIINVEGRMSTIETTFDSLVTGTGYATTQYVDTGLTTKANTVDVYTKTEVDTKISNIDVTSTVYTKSEVDTKLNLKADKSELDNKSNLGHTHTVSDIDGLTLDASNVSYNNITSGMSATSTQSAIDELHSILIGSNTVLIQTANGMLSEI